MSLFNRQKKDVPPPWAPYLPPSWEKADIASIQALGRGDATPDQQKRALDYIINKVCRTYDLSYSPTSDRETSMAEGRRFVGLHMVFALKLNLSKIKDRNNV